MADPLTGSLRPRGGRFRFPTYAHHGGLMALEVLDTVAVLPICYA